MFNQYDRKYMQTWLYSSIKVYNVHQLSPIIGKQVISLVIAEEGYSSLALVSHAKTDTHKKSYNL